MSSEKRKIFLSIGRKDSTEGLLRPFLEILKKNKLY